MPQRIAGKRQFQFTKGLHTEGGYLTPAPGTWADGTNMVPNLDGSLRRRKRVDYEASASAITTLSTASASLLATSAGEWNAAQGNGALNYVCIQVGHMLYFRRNTIPVSGTALWTIDLNDYAVAGTPVSVKYVPCQYTSGLGKFFITSQAINPLMLTLNEDEVSVTVRELDLKIRDLEGIDDGLADDERPTSLSPEHHYNLLNQGWDTTYIYYFYQGGLGWQGVTDYFYTGPTGTFPSHITRQSWGDNSEADGLGGFHWNWPRIIELAGRTSLTAPKGRFLISPFGDDRGAISGVSGLPADTIVYTRPTTIAFMAGRAWYGGINSVDLGSWVLFSQTGLGSDKFDNCCQAAEPTSQDDADVVDTDGGVITIHEAGTVLKLVPIKDMMVVLADNGVWQISSDGGFRATQYSVTKVTDLACISAYSVVTAGERVYYWSDSGIVELRLADGQVSPLLQATSITDTTISTFYQDDIGTIAKINARGLYHQDEKRIYWLYDGETGGDGVYYRGRKTKALVLDLRLGAWYTLKFAYDAADSTFPWIFDATVTKPLTEGTPAEFDVSEDDGTLVVTSGAVQVVVVRSTLTSASRVLKFWAFGYNTGGEVNEVVAADMIVTPDTDGENYYRDWYTVDPDIGQYDAYIETQWEEDGLGAEKRLSAHYVTVFCEKTEEGWYTPPE